MDCMVTVLGLHCGEGRELSGIDYPSSTANLDRLHPALGAAKSQYFFSERLNYPLSIYFRPPWRRAPDVLDFIAEGSQCSQRSPSPGMGSQLTHDFNRSAIWRNEIDCSR